MVLSIRDLCAGYSGKTILQNVSFSVGKGELVSLVGPNGAGKSTLLKTIRGLLPALQGKIFLQGTDITKLSEGEFARRAGYLQQQMQVPFAYTVREIVQTGRYPYLHWWQQPGKQDEEIIRASLAYTGALEFLDRPVQELSGGQQQRVFLAKVLAQQTPILLLDEPATGLDLIYQEEIFRFCRGLCAAGRTIVMVVHELSLAARFSSRLFLLSKGKVLAEGKPEQVLTPELLTKAYGVPVAVEKNPLTGHMDIYTTGGGCQADRQEKLLATVLGREVTE